MDQNYLINSQCILLETQQIYLCEDIFFPMKIYLFVRPLSIQNPSSSATGVGKHASISTICDINSKGNTKIFASDAIAGRGWPENGGFGSDVAVVVDLIGGRGWCFGQAPEKYLDCLEGGSRVSV